TCSSTSGALTSTTRTWKPSVLLRMALIWRRCSRCRVRMSLSARSPSIAVERRLRRLAILHLHLDVAAAEAGAQLGSEPLSLLAVAEERLLMLRPGALCRLALRRRIGTVQVVPAHHVHFNLLGFVPAVIGRGHTFTPGHRTMSSREIRFP